MRSSSGHGSIILIIVQLVLKLTLWEIIRYHSTQSQFPHSSFNFGFGSAEIYNTWTVLPKKFTLIGFFCNCRLYSHALAMLLHLAIHTKVWCQLIDATQSSTKPGCIVALHFNFYFYFYFLSCMRLLLVLGCNSVKENLRPSFQIFNSSAQLLLTTLNPFVCLWYKEKLKKKVNSVPSPTHEGVFGNVKHPFKQDFKDRKEIIDHVDMNFFKATKFCLSWKSKLAENLQLTCPLIYSLLLQSQLQNMLSIIVINALILNLTRLVFSFCDTSGNSIIPTKSLTTNH